MLSGEQTALDVLQNMSLMVTGMWNDEYLWQLITTPQINARPAIFNNNQSNYFHAKHKVCAMTWSV